MLAANDEPTEAAEGTPSEASEPMPTDEIPGVLVDNQSDAVICEIYIAPREDEEWGDNRLDQPRLKPRYSYRVPDIPPGQYDFMALDCRGDLYDRHDGVTVDGQGDHIWVLEPADAEVLIINSTNADICEVNISHTEDDLWGVNQLDEEEVIVPNGSFTIPDIPVGVYDLKATGCDEVEYEQLNVDLSGLYSWTVQ
jgi:hypothetical protein